LFRILAGACCALALAAGGPAQAAFPDQPIRIIVAFGPGGLADITVRLVGEKLTRLLGQPVVIDNRPGAGGIPAAQAAMSAKADGYTLLVVSNGTAITKSLYKKLPFDPEKDFTPVSLMAYYDLALLVRKDSPYRSLADLLADVRAHPGKINFATINPGSTQNLSAELFKTAAGIDAAIVPFRNTPDVTRALLAGDVEIGFESYAALKAQIDSGSLRALATSAAQRSGYLPSVPTVRESGVAYEVTGWNGLAAPAGTPPEAVAVLNRAVNSIIAMPEIRQRFLGLGTEAFAGTPEDLRRQMAGDIVKWAAVIKRAGIPQE
jgi:tripartite-type tricarboxylate transporter receptor subunit TctC